MTGQGGGGAGRWWLRVSGVEEGDSDCVMLQDRGSGEEQRACGRENAKEDDGEGGRAVEETAKWQFSLIKQTHEEKEPLKEQVTKKKKRSPLLRSKSFVFPFRS